MTASVNVRKAAAYAALASFLSCIVPQPLLYSDTPVNLLGPLIDSGGEKAALTETDQDVIDRQSAALESYHEVFFEGSPLSPATPENGAVLSMTAVAASVPAVSVSGYNVLGKNPPLVGYGALIPLDRTHFSYRYDIGAAPGAVVDLAIAQSGEGMNLGDSFSIGLRRQNKTETSEGLSELHIVFIDADGEEFLETVSLTEAEITHSIDLTGTSFDSSRTTQIILRQSYGDLEREKVVADRRGEIFVTLDSLDSGARMPIPVSGQAVPQEMESFKPAGAAYSASGFSPIESAIPGFIRKIESETGYGFAYDVGGSAKAAVKAVLQKSPELELDSPVLLAVRNSGNAADAKVRVLDNAGNSAVYILDLGADFKLYSLDLQDAYYYSGAFDPASISGIEIEVDRTLSGERRGEVHFQLLRTFVDPFTAAKPQVTSSSTNSAGQGLIHFSAVPEAVLYQIQAAKDPAFADIVYEGFPSELQERISFTEADTYYIRVRASKSQQVEAGPLSQWSDTLSLNVPGNTFSAVKPVINQLSEIPGARLEVSFAGVPDAALYEVQASAVSDFSTLIHQGFPQAGPEAFDMDGHSVIYVRVRASIQEDVNAGPVSQWSDVSVYDRQAAFAQQKPVIQEVLPASSEIIFSTLSGADYYEYQISPSGTFADITAGGTVNAPPAVFSAIIPGNYFARVRGAVESGSQDVLSQWSDASSFNVPEPASSFMPDPALMSKDISILPLGQDGPVQTASVGPSEGGAMNAAAATERGVEIAFNTGTAGWSGGGFRYDDFATAQTKEYGNLSGLQALTFGISGGVTGVKLEIIDALGGSDSVQLSGITDTEKFWRIPLNEFQGVDFAKVSYIYFIVEGNNKAGVLSVNRLPEIFPLSSSPALTASAFPNYPTGTAGPLMPAVVGPDGVNASAAISAAERGVVLQYSTGSAGWAGGGVAYDNFQTTTVETGNLSPLNRLVFGLKGTSSSVKMEISDLQGRKVAIPLQGINANEEKFWEIPVSLLDALNLDGITLILFIVEGTNQQGSLEINYLKQPQIILPQASLEPEDLTGLPQGEIGSPVHASIGPAGTVNAAQPTARGMTVQYGTGVPGWAGGGLSYDNFSSAILEKADLSGIDHLTFGIKGTAPVLKFELIDTAGGKFTIPIKNISADEERIFRIPRSVITGVDLTKIRLMYFIVEGPELTGTFEVNHLPPPFELLPSALTPAQIVDFTAQGTDHLAALAPDGASSVMTASPRGAFIDYETRDKGWAGGGISFDDFSTTSVETADFSGLSHMTFGLKGIPSKVKLEVIDSEGNKASVPIAGILPGEEKVWSLPLSLLTGVDLSEIRFIYFIVEGNDRTGRLELYTAPA